MIGITVFAPREDDDTDYDEPDDADWTIEEAMQVAGNFLPAGSAHHPAT